MEYSAGIISTLLWWSETQQTAQLLWEHKTRADIMRLSCDENIFNVRSKDRRRRIAGVTYKRVQALPPELAAYLCDAGFREAQCIVLLSVMCTERIFKEFCEDVLHEAIVSQTFTITDAAVRAFLQQKINQSPKVAGFSDSAVQKLKQTCIKFLYDGGILESTKGERAIVPPMIAPGLADLIAQCGLGAYYQLLTGSSL